MKVFFLSIRSDYFDHNLLLIKKKLNQNRFQKSFSFLICCSQIYCHLYDKCENCRRSLTNRSICFMIFIIFWFKHLLSDWFFIWQTSCMVRYSQYFYNLYYQLISAWINVNKVSFHSYQVFFIFLIITYLYFVVCFVFQSLNI